jgi:hypothetical protein
MNRSLKTCQHECGDPLVKSAEGKQEPCVWAEWEYDGKPRATGWGWNGKEIGRLEIDTIPK